MLFPTKSNWFKSRERRTFSVNKWGKLEDLNSSSASLLEDGDDATAFYWQKPHSQQLYQHWLWICSTLFFACSTIFLYVQSLPGRNCRQSYTEGYSTDLRAISKNIKIEEVRFGGALTYNETGTLVIEHAPGERIWVGNPSPEIDALWDHVEAASMVFLEGPEADQSREHTSFFNGYWLTGLDVFHQLHCLNQVRKALYPDYYIPDDSLRTHKLHFEHCLDYVRQALMCNADTTPVTHKFFKGADIFAPDFNTLHTCRNFDQLLEWSLERNSAAADRKGAGSETTSDSGRIVDKEHVAGGHEEHH